MSLSDHFKAIASSYAAIMPEWMEDYEATGNMHHDPYVMDWRFTPIEKPVWGDIRDMALPFYPQIPACGYFLDFANPFLRIGIECDGRQWHDAERDRLRDARLSDAGWMIFRIEGHECRRIVDLHTEYDEELPPGEICRHYESTSEGVLRAIKWAYFGGQDPHNSAMLMCATLDAHRSTPDTYPRAKPVIPRNSGPRLIGDMLADHIRVLERRMERARRRV